MTPADADAAAHVFVAALDDAVTVDGPDGHHLERVRRLGPGERVTAADGTGAWRTYEVVSVARGALSLRADGSVEIEALPPIPVAVAIALTKGGIDDAVAAVTELGAATVTPVVTERSVVRWDAARAVRAVDRLRVVAREAAMQCRRARITEIEAVTDLSAVAGRPGLVVADRTGSPVSALRPDPARGWTVLVGPEGGFGPTDEQHLVNVPRLRLSPHVLRAVTAPVAAVAVLTEFAAQMGPE